MKILKTRDIINKVFRTNEEYHCEKLETFLKKITLPIPFSKQKGVFFMLVTAGEINMTVGYEKYEVTRGELIIIQPEKPFLIENFSADIQGYMLNLKGGSVLGSMGNHSLIFSLEFLETWSNSRFIIDRPPIEYVENLFRRIQWEKEHHINKFAIVNAYVITLLLEVNNIYNEVAESNRAAIDLNRRFKNEVYKTMDAQVSLTEYAGRLSVTPNHLNKSIKSTSGMSASQLISKIKVTEAKYLLMMSDITITEIAGKLGFEDASYFSRFFKKCESISPTDFRKMIDLS